ncbi:hypothetical protein FACS189472_15720 [Alphaproteobacteria bacterium]|nr:hypothetical protein FACS189472_15720 [Alphaproteobacteria bacterium]
MGGSTQNIKITGSITVGSETQPDSVGLDGIFGAETLIAGNVFREVEQDSFTEASTRGGEIQCNSTVTSVLRRAYADGVQTRFKLKRETINDVSTEKAVMHADRNVRNEDTTRQKITVTHDMINVGNIRNLDGKITVNGKITVGNSTRDGALEVLGEVRIRRSGTNTTNLVVYGNISIGGVSLTAADLVALKALI